MEKVNFLHFIDFTIFLRIKNRGLRDYIRQVDTLQNPAPPGFSICWRSLKKYIFIYKKQHCFLSYFIYYKTPNRCGKYTVAPLTVYCGLEQCIDGNGLRHQASFFFFRGCFGFLTSFFLTFRFCTVY